MPFRSRDVSWRSEDLFPLGGLSRRVERGVQTCSKPKAFSSCLYAAASRRVSKLQDQVERLQHRNSELEEEQKAARQSFQNRLQSLHESWQDCFDRHQHSWTQQRYQAEGAWNEEKFHLQAKITSLTLALDHWLGGVPCKADVSVRLHVLRSPADTGLMEDAAVQAGSNSGKSRACQTPYNNSGRASRSGRNIVGDLSRTQSLPSEQHDWLAALASTEIYAEDFGDVAAEYAQKVSEGQDVTAAASKFAGAAALHAQGMSQPALADSFFSSSASDASSVSDEPSAFSFFTPLREEGNPRANLAPVPDQSWWEEFGEWESAATVTPQQRAHAFTQPRLVLEDQIVRLPIFKQHAGLSYAAHGDVFEAPNHSKAKAQPVTPRPGAASLNPFQLADDEDVWQNLSQPAAKLHVNLKQTDSKRALEESEELHADPKVQKARFPSPSSSFWGLQDSEQLPPTPVILKPRTSPTPFNPWGLQDLTPANPWGLQDVAPAVMHISKPSAAAQADVSYTPVEAFQPMDEVSTPKPTVEGHLFSASNAFPVTFEDSASEDCTAMVEIVDLSAGDVISIGGPKSCAWDASSSMTQHRTPSFPRSSLEARFAAELDDDSTAQHEQLLSLNSNSNSASQRGQVSASEQAAQTGVESPSEHSAQSTRPAARPATLDELAGLLLPQSCRVAARVPTKLPPLDHYPTLPPLPEGFILPPEMHPVVGSYTKTRAKTASTGSQTAAAWSGTTEIAAADVEDMIQDISSMSHAQQGASGTGKWVHPKQTPPAPKPRQASNLLDDVSERIKMSVQELLTPTPMSDLVLDVLSFRDSSLELAEPPLPAFASRLADSGFMTCQLAQILAPIRAASAPVASTAAAPSDAKSTLATSFSSLGSAANSAADTVDEASLEAAVESLLTQIGIECTAQPLSRTDSDAHSEFEVVNRAASDAQTAGTDIDAVAEQRLGPKAQLSRSALSAPEADHSFDQDIFAAETRPRKIFSVIDYSAFDDFTSESSISLEDGPHDFGDESGMTVHDMSKQPAMTFADSGTGISSEDVQRWASLTRSDSNAESSHDTESDGCMVSAHSFDGESTDDEAQEVKGADGEDWEML